VKTGDCIAADQYVSEVETNKATMNVTAPCPGRVEKLLVRVNESYPVGAVLGYLDASVEDAARLGLDQPVPAGEQEVEPGTATTENPSNGYAKQGVEPTVRGLPVPAHAAGASYMSPRMKARMNELGLHAADLAGIAGSGAAGRVTIQDFEHFIANLERSKLTSASSMRVAVFVSWSRTTTVMALRLLYRKCGCICMRSAPRRASASWSESWAVCVR